MPIYEYRCPSGHQFEYLSYWPPPIDLLCDQCGRKAQPIPTAPGLLGVPEVIGIHDSKVNSFEREVRLEMARAQASKRREERADRARLKGRATS